MWRYFFLIVKLLKITNMSEFKTLNAAELYACISEDKHSNRSMAFNKHDIVDSFVAGAEFMQKEYEEKFRWIPVDEKLPKIYSAVLAVINSPNQTWVEEIGFGETKFMLPGRGETDFVTHWMYIPEPPSFL